MYSYGTDRFDKSLHRDAIGDYNCWSYFYKEVVFPYSVGYIFSKQFKNFVLEKYSPEKLILFKVKLIPELFMAEVKESLGHRLFVQDIHTFHTYTFTYILNLLTTHLPHRSVRHATLHPSLPISTLSISPVHRSLAELMSAPRYYCRTATQQRTRCMPCGAPVAAGYWACEEPPCAGAQVRCSRK